MGAFRGLRLPDVRVSLVLVPLALVALGLGRAPGAEAQVRGTLAPVAGAYLGFGSFHGLPEPSPFGGTSTFSQQTGVALGVEGMLWVGSHVGLGFHVVTASSKVGASQYLTLTDPVDARVTVVGAQLLFPVHRSAEKAVVYAAAGASVVRRSGDAYDGFEGTSDVGAELGFGTLYRLSPRISLTGNAGALLYSLSLKPAGGASAPSSFQTDLLARVGIAVELGNHMEE
jgi:hypothetical protein